MQSSRRRRPAREVEANRGRVSMNRDVVNRASHLLDPSRRPCPNYAKLLKNWTAARFSRASGVPRIVRNVSGVGGPFGC